MGEHEQEQGGQPEQEPVEGPETPREGEEEEAEAEKQPEPPDEGEPPEGAQSGGQPQASQVDMEAAFKKLDQSATTWRNRVSVVLGEVAQDLVICPLCADVMPGFLWPVEPPEEVKQRVAAQIGLVQAMQLKTDKYAHVCPDCDGWGKVATGSHVEGFDAMVCKDCNGAGTVGPRFEQQGPPLPQAPNGPVELPAPEAPAGALPQFVLDALREHNMMALPKPSGAPVPS